MEPSLPGLLVQHLYLLLKALVNEMQVAFRSPNSPKSSKVAALEKAELGSPGSPGEVEWSPLPISGIALPNLDLK